MLDLSWMAWTTPTASFFLGILFLLIMMAIWEWWRPGGNERRGILGIVTTRGDRLFISLLCAAYIHLGWLLVTSFHPGYATALSVLMAVFIFRRV